MGSVMFRNRFWWYKSLYDDYAGREMRSAFGLASIIWLPHYWYGVHFNRKMEELSSHKNYYVEYGPRRNRLTHSLMFEEFEIVMENWQKFGEADSTAGKEQPRRSSSSLMIHQGNYEPVSLVYLAIMDGIAPTGQADQHGQPDSDNSQTPSKSASMLLNKQQEHDLKVVPKGDMFANPQRSRKATSHRKKHNSNVIQAMMSEQDNVTIKPIKDKKITDYFAGSMRVSNVHQETLVEPSEWDPAIRRKQEGLIAKEKEVLNLRKQFAQVEEGRTHHQLMLETYRKKAREVLIQTISENYAYKRRQKQMPNTRLGFFKNLYSEDFVEGPLFFAAKERMNRLSQKLKDLEAQFKNTPSEPERKVLEYRLSTLTKQKKETESMLKLLHDQKIQLLNRLRLSQQEIHCRMAKDNWAVVNDRYLPLELLGKGGFSEVYLCFDLDSRTNRAMKISHISATVGSRQQYMKHVIRQYKTHKSLDHQNIAKVHDVILLNQQCIITVLEYCEGSDLAVYIKKEGSIPESTAKMIIRQMLDALKYMDSLPTKIIHYDLKPQNILLHEGLVKIVDFGLCKIVDETQTKIELTSQGSGTYWYLPPQTFDNNQKISNKVDVWSVGVIFFEMLYGRRPFGHGMSQAKILHEGIIVSSARNVQFPMEPEVSEQCKDFIRGCLEYHQDKRYSVVEAYNKLPL